VGAYTNLNPFTWDDMLATVLMLVIMADTGSIGGIIVVGLIFGCLNAVLPVVLTDDCDPPLLNYPISGSSLAHVNKKNLTLPGLCPECGSHNYSRL